MMLMLLSFTHERNLLVAHLNVYVSLENSVHNYNILYSNGYKKAAEKIHTKCSQKMSWFTLSKKSARQTDNAKKN